MRDVVAVGDRIEESGKPDLLQDKRCILGRRSDSQKIPLLAQRVKRFLHLGRKIRRCHLGKELFVQLVLLIRKGILLRLRKRTGTLFQNDVQTCHAAHAPQTVVDRAVKRNADAVRDRFPRAVMVFVRIADDAVQVKDDRIELLHCFVSSLPQNGSIGLFPVNALRPISFSMIASRASGVPA